MHEKIKALREGKTIDLGGINLQMEGDGEVGEGDLYIAARNTGPHLLTAKKVQPTGEGGYIIPTTGNYMYDICDTVKVREA